LKATKFLIALAILFGALLTAKLLPFLNQHDSPKTLELQKPSQFSFKKTNQLSQNKINQSSSSVSKKISADDSDLPKALALQADDKSSWLVLKSIFLSKNDNDPRMDTQLKKLSPAVHEALFEKYDSLPDEDRSAKGLIVFLISRNLNSIEDIQFLKKVYQESPCLSLANCKTLAPDNTHHSAVDQTTLTYPQQTFLYVIEKQLTENPELLNNSAFKSAIIQLLVQAENFPVPSVHDKARAIRLKFKL
jgi:hypothetical protein